MTSQPTRGEFMAPLFLKNFLYFAQTVALLGNSSTSKSFLKPLAEFFNFTFSTGGSGGYCINKGFTPYDLIWLEFMIPGLLLFWFGFFVLLDRSNLFPKISLKLKHHRSTGWTLFLIVFGQITMVLLKFLACRKVDNEWYLWYTGSVKCFTSFSFTFGLIGLIGVLFIPLWVYYRLWNSTTQERTEDALTALTGIYFYIYLKILSDCYFY